MAQPPTGTLLNQESAINSSADADTPTGTFAALRIPSFAWFIAGTTLSNAGQWIQQVTLSWLVYDLTASGAMLGTLNLVRSLATIGLAPMAGVAIDRFSRRGLLHATSLWLCVISAGFGFVLLGGSQAVWLLLLFSFLGGIGQAISMPLSQTVVFSVVPRPLAPAAVALVQTGWAVMRSLGPMIGGFLILWFGPAGNFFVQAVAYALVSLTVMKLTMPYEKAGAAKARASGSFREGWTYIVAQPSTRAFLFMSWVLPLFIIPNFNALPPIYAKDVFGGGPDTLGLLLSAIGIGGIVGGFVTASLGKLERRGLLQLGSLLLLSFALIGFALSAIFWVAWGFMVLAGFFEMIYLTTNLTLLQLSIPDELRGRVTGIVSLRSGLMPVGAFIAGVGADWVGPQIMTLILGAITGAVAILVFFGSAIVRDYRLSENLTEQ